MKQRYEKMPAGAREKQISRQVEKHEEEIAQIQVFEYLIYHRHLLIYYRTRMLTYADVC